MAKATKRLARKRVSIKTLPRLRLSNDARELIREQNRVHRMLDEWRHCNLRGKAGKLKSDRLRAEYDKAHAAYSARCTALVEGKRTLPIDRDALATLAVIAYDQGNHTVEAKFRLYFAVLHAAGVTVSKRTKWRLRVSRD
jgi:chromosome segregation and condensation protein ScpB